MRKPVTQGPQPTDQSATIPSAAAGVKIQNKMNGSLCTLGIGKKKIKIYVTVP